MGLSVDWIANREAKEPKLQRHLLFPGQGIEYEHQSLIRYVVALQNT